MPYIPFERREAILHGALADTSGELNYRFTRIMLDYLRTHNLSYQTINDIKGASQGALAEFDRRVTAPYEDRKIVQNGDVYPRAVVPEAAS